MAEKQRITKKNFYKKLKYQIQTVSVPTGDHCSPDGFLKEFHLDFILIMVFKGICNYITKTIEEFRGKSLSAIWNLYLKLAFLSGAYV